MTRREKAYQRKIQQLIDQVGKLTDREVAKVLALLEAARKEVAARVAATEWQAQHIPELKRAVEEALDTFKRRYLSGQAAALSNMWEAGIDAVDLPLTTAGIRIAAPEIARTSLEILQGFSADLITNMTGDAVKKINAEISMGILGQKTPFEVMQGVGRNLKDKSVFKTIAHRAETITRTEMARVHSSARQARLLDVAGTTEPDIRLMKQWIHSGAGHARENHLALDGVMVPLEEPFPGGIPYPHAPGLEAAETINCGCSHVAASPDWGDLPKAWDPVPYQARAIYD